MTLICDSLRAYLGCSKEIYWLKSKYLFIAILLYCVQKCLVWTRPYKIKKTKRHFSSNIFFLWELKIFTFGQFCSKDVYGYYSLFRKSSLMPGVWKYFEMWQHYFEEKKYLFNKMFFFLSFYQNIVQENAQCV